MADPVGTVTDPIDWVVATAFVGRASTIRPISADENSRSPELVLKVIFSGDEPSIS
jgi:hypothetical protein